MRETLHVQRCTGAELERYVPELARLRIEVFRDFPYLYDGDPDYEARYLRTYSQSPGSVAVLVFDGERVVGASTGVPLEHETAEVKRPFITHGYDPRSLFYFGESVLDKAYRGRGLGVRFFAEREAHARSVGDFQWTAFCAVQRPDDHPLRPAGYAPLDAFWQKRGYRRHPDLHTTFSWRDLGETEESAKPMVFWLKAMQPQA
jgi:GNAT superfamily N-acetyltransferase